MIILGLDISSSTIGWACLTKANDKMDLLNYGYIKPPKKELGGMSFRLDNTVIELRQLLLTTKPTMVVVEDYARKFQQGKSSAGTISILTSFNEVACLTAYQYNQLEPERITVASIRSSIGKYLNIKTISKDDVFGIISGEFSSGMTKNFKPEINRAGNVKKEYFDVSDAIAVAMAYLVK